MSKENQKISLANFDNEKSDDDFATRSIMSIVTEIAELKETTQRLMTVAAALALMYGVSTDV